MRNWDKYINTTKEERAKILHNIICPKCKYHNHEFYIKKYGKCNLCGITLDSGYFKRKLMRMCKNG